MSRYKIHGNLYFNSNQVIYLLDYIDHNKHASPANRQTKFIQEIERCLQTVVQSKFQNSDTNKCFGGEEK